LITWVLGDYARKIPTEMLMSHRRNPAAPSPDIMLLKGLRLAWASETEEGQRLAEALVKSLTGGDTLTGRVPHAKTFVQFRQTHKLTIVGNYQPEVRDNSHGMWRRMTLVPFNVTIPEENDDRSLDETLKAEGAGILNWMLAGLRDYQTNGLKVPKAIRDATKIYREEQDIVGEWIADSCVTGKGLRDDKRSLYANYAYWARESGYMAVSQKRLTRQLRDHGYPLDPGKRSIIGITLKTSCIGEAYSSAMEAAATAPGIPVLRST
jgi:putative DNA primase/helicase